MTQENRRQISRLLINRSLQLRLIFISIGYMTLMLAITLSVALLPTIHSMFGAPDPQQQYESAQTFLILARRLVPVALCLFFLFFIHIIVLTHRICGPLGNFARTFECMVDGDFSRRIHLRKRDCLHYEAALINEAQENLRDQIQAIQEENRALTQELSQPPPTAEALVRIKKRNETLTELLETFRL